MEIGFYLFLVLSFCSAQGYALYSEQRAEQSRNQYKVVAEKAIFRAVLDAKTMAKWTPTRTPTPDKRKPTSTPSPTPSPTPIKQLEAR